jgi:hypothetical protein
LATWPGLFAKQLVQPWLQLWGNEAIWTHLSDVELLQKVELRNAAEKWAVNGL